MTMQTDMRQPASGLQKSLVLVYTTISYTVFLVSFLYAIGFVGNFVVPKTIDSGGPSAPLLQALLIDALLLGFFAVQHSVMARPAFKRWWTKFIPQPIERSTFVLFASLILLFIYWQWIPLPMVIWQVENVPASLILQGLAWIGWLIVLLSTFMINHFDLFGLRQAYQYLSERTLSPIDFKTTGFYRVVRHPILLGFIIAFWATPQMTLGHLVFAIATTVWMLIAIQLEEHDLVLAFGDTYRRYRKQVFMLLPIPKGKRDL